MRLKIILMSCIVVVFSMGFVILNAGVVDYPWLKSGSYDHGQSIEKRIPVPETFKRVQTPEGSFGAWLRSLPLMPEGSPVRLYPVSKAKFKSNSDAHYAVIKMDVLRFQQCADAVIRLRAEYLWSSQMQDAICFQFTNGFACSWEKWTEGWRPDVISGQDKVNWVKTTSGDNSRYQFMKYLDKVMEYAGTVSLSRGLLKIVPSEIRNGDVILQGGSPGHAVLVLDIAENDKGEKVMLLGQSYMPAQEFYVLKNPEHKFSPWYKVNADGFLVTPECTFDMVKDCRRFMPVKIGTTEQKIISGNQDNNELRNAYPAKIYEIQNRQDEFRAQYEATESDEEKRKIVKDCRDYIFETLTKDIFPAWCGTTWGYNGSSRVPGKGKIACGTFVVYTLQDMGFKIPSKMSLQPSENIIKNLIGPSQVKRLWNSAPMERVMRWVNSQGEGLFIVGLDIHVGFIINKSGKITFCHSNYYNPPMMVVNQHAMEKSPLTDSKYRVLGKILDDQMMIKWLKKEPFPLTYNFYRRD